VPHSTKPTAKAGNDGTSTQSAKPAPVSSGARTRSSRRETASAHTPDGISTTRATTAQTTKSDEISAVDSPVSSKRRA